LQRRRIGKAFRRARHPRIFQPTDRCGGTGLDARNEPSDLIKGLNGKPSGKTPAIFR